MKICLKSWKSPKCYCFVKLNLTDRFGKENSQFTKNIRKTQNWSYQKMFCIILSNFCFFVLFGMKKCFMLWKMCLVSWKFAWSHESLKNTIVLVNWTWLTVLERKTPNSPKIYAKHKIGPTKKNCFAWFWAILVFCDFCGPEH